MADYKTQLNIEDMTCDPCVRVVKGALERTPGVDRADVGLGAGSSTVAGAADVRWGQTAKGQLEAAQRLLRRRA